MSYLRWGCFECRDILTSKSNVSHQTDYCKCLNSGVDYEENYVRYLGFATPLKEFNWNFFEELFIGYGKQEVKHDLNIKELLDLLEEIEDEILENLK